MELRTRVEGNTVIMAFTGNLMGGPDTAAVQHTIHDLIQEGKRNVVIDLKAVNRMNSSGLGLLISALTTVRSNGGDLKLANANEKIQSLLTITQLNRIFEEYSSVEEASNSFG